MLAALRSKTALFVLIFAALSILYTPWKVLFPSHVVVFSRVAPPGALAVTPELEVKWNQSYDSALAALDSGDYSFAREDLLNAGQAHSGEYLELAEDRARVGNIDSALTVYSAELELENAPASQSDPFNYLTMMHRDGQCDAELLSQFNGTSGNQMAFLLDKIGEKDFLAGESDKGAAWLFIGMNRLFANNSTAKEAFQKCIAVKETDSIEASLATGELIELNSLGWRYSLFNRLLHYSVPVLILVILAALLFGRTFTSRITGVARTPRQEFRSGGSSRMAG